MYVHTFYPGADP